MVNSPFLCTFVPVYHARGYSYRKIKRATRSGGFSRNIRHKKEGARGSFFYFALAFFADADDSYPCQRCQAQDEQCASVRIVAGLRCILVVRFIRGGRRGGCTRRAWGCRMTWCAWARWCAWVGWRGWIVWILVVIRFFCVRNVGWIVWIIGVWFFRIWNVGWIIRILWFWIVRIWIWFLRIRDVSWIIRFWIFRIWVRSFRIRNVGWNVVVGDGDDAIFLGDGGGESCRHVDLDDAPAVNNRQFFPESGPVVAVAQRDRISPWLAVAIELDSDGISTRAAVVDRPFFVGADLCGFLGGKDRRKRCQI